jgi:murein L,D-transpeptidase YafK
MSGHPIRLLIEKRARRLYVLSPEGTQASYEVRLGKNSDADKEMEGDYATPLGDFYVCAKNPRSKYFLSLCLSYPNAEDAARGRASGLIGDAEYAQIMEALAQGKIPPQHTRLGGEIYIHGHAEAAHPAGRDPVERDPVERDWTRGCIAVDNVAMRKLYDLAVVGTPVRISP